PVRRGQRSLLSVALLRERRRRRLLPRTGHHVRGALLRVRQRAAALGGRRIARRPAPPQRPERRSRTALPEDREDPGHGGSGPPGARGTGGAAVGPGLRWVRGPRGFGPTRICDSAVGVRKMRARSPRFAAAGRGGRKRCTVPPASSPRPGPADGRRYPDAHRPPLDPPRPGTAADLTSE